MVVMKIDRAIDIDEKIRENLYEVNLFMTLETRLNFIKRRYYTVVIMYELGIALFSATLYLYMESVGYTLSEINAYISMFWLVSFVAEIPSGALSDAFGRRNTTVLSGVIRAFGLLSISLGYKSDILLFISAIFTALGSALYSGSMSSWVIDEINKIYSDYDFNNLFSKTNIWSTMVSLIGGFLGAQLIGAVNLAYPTIASAMVLLTTSIITYNIIKNDRSIDSDKISIKKFLPLYLNILRDGINFFREKKFVFWVVISFVSTSFITTAPFNQWQIYFKKEDVGIISGYLYVSISVCAILGSILVSKIKSKNNFTMFLVSNILICFFISTSVLVKNFYVSVLFFLVHVVIATYAQVISFTYLNKFLQEKTRSTVLSIYYACEAIFVVFVMKLNSYLYISFDIGMSWIILSFLGIILMFLSSKKVKKGDIDFVED